MNTLFDDTPKNTRLSLFEELPEMPPVSAAVNVEVTFVENKNVPDSGMEKLVNPLFEVNSIPELPPVAQKVPTVFAAAPLLPPAPLTPAPPDEPSVSAIMGTQTLVMAPPARVPVTAEAAFSENIDPLAERALSFLKQKYPQCSDDDYRHWKGVLSTLFPLTVDNWLKIGQSGLETAQRIMAEISEVTNRYAVISPTTVLSRVAVEAQQAAQSSHSLLSRITHHFDEGRAKGQVMAVIGGLKSLVSKLDSVILLAGQVVEQFKTEVPILEAIEHIAGSDFQSGMLCRRRELLLTSAQQMSMANQQAEVLKKEIIQARMSADEVINVTLPALGFSAAIS